MISSDDAFVVDIGRAGNGKTFVRVRHIETGKERAQVGLDGSTASEIAKRLAHELTAEINALSQH